MFVLFKQFNRLLGSFDGLAELTFFCTVHDAFRFGSRTTNLDFLGLREFVLILFQFFVISLVGSGDKFFQPFDDTIQRTVVDGSQPIHYFLELYDVALFALDSVRYHFELLVQEVKERAVRILFGIHIASDSLQLAFERSKTGNTHTGKIQQIAFNVCCKLFRFFNRALHFLEFPFRL